MKDETNDNVEVTSFKGYVLATYETLINLFGAPSLGDGYKTDAEWWIITPHGIARIYNYKDGKAYLGGRGRETTEILEWHVGARNVQSYDWIKSKIEHTVMNRF